MLGYFIGENVLRLGAECYGLRRGHHVGGILVMTVQATHGIVDEYAILNHIWLI